MWAIRSKKMVARPSRDHFTGNREFAQLAQSLPYTRRARVEYDSSLNDRLTYGGGGAFVGSVATEGCAATGYVFTVGLFICCDRYALTALPSFLGAGAGNRRGDARRW